MSFYDGLVAVCNDIATSLTDEGDEGSRPVSVYWHQSIDLNYPWMYLSFGYTGPLNVAAFERIRQKVNAYLEVNEKNGGLRGRVESICMHARGSGFMVKIILSEYDPLDTTPKDEVVAGTCELPDHKPKSSSP